VNWVIRHYNTQWTHQRSLSMNYHKKANVKSTSCQNQASKRDGLIPRPKFVLSFAIKKDKSHSFWKPGQNCITLNFIFGSLRALFSTQCYLVINYISLIISRFSWCKIRVIRNYFLSFKLWKNQDEAEFSLVCEFISTNW
jgi:hypothetical protein